MDQQGNYYGNNMYNNYYQQPARKGNGVGFGIASLVLGIVSLLLFCTCINWITAILAIIFGIVQITANREHGLAIGGIITAGMSLLFNIMFWIFLFWSGAGEQNMNYYDYYDYYDNYYDSKDYYDSDDYYDYDVFYDYYNDYYDSLPDSDEPFYQEEGGADFLSY